MSFKRIPFKISGDPNDELNQCRIRLNLSLRHLRAANKLKLKNRGKRLAAYKKDLSDLRHFVNGTKRPERLEIHYCVTIDGIPAGVHIGSYTSPKDWVQHTFKGAGPGDCDPPEDEEVEWEIVDSKGYPANWLFKKAEKKGHFDEFVMKLIRDRSAPTAF